MGLESLNYFYVDLLFVFLSLVAVIRGMIFVAPTSAEHLLRQQKSLFSEVQVRQTLLPVFAVLIL